MKILYAIQGTGNGHLARAEDVVPILRTKGDLDIFISGAQADLDLPYEVTHRSKGLSFFFGKNGGVDIAKTIKKNNTRTVYKEIHDFPVTKYDLVVNDFEPISAWAARLRKIPCISLSHQASLLSKKVPKPHHYDPIGAWILKNYAPATAHIGFHFKEFDNDIFTPVIRSRVRNTKVTDLGHYTVYLPSYDDKKLVPLLSRFADIKWHVFSKHTKTAYYHEKVMVFPISNEGFMTSMASSRGVLCGAGFETPAEALFLNKKLMVVPMKKQYEQHYNAAALNDLGVRILKKVRKKHFDKMQSWIDSEERVAVQYEDTTALAVNRALSLL
jgi:uncharacterized protein (TIGR00661 family)